MSLIKAKGGCKKIKKYFNYEKLSNLAAEHYLNYFNKLNDDNLSDVKKKLDEINPLIEELYINCKIDASDNFYKSTAADLPLCVVIAIAINHLCFNFGEADEIIKKFKTKGCEYLNDLVSSRSLDMTTSSFEWWDSPEGGGFWSEVFYRKRDNEHRKDHEAIKISKLYDDFIKVHPECEEEIKEFCKQ